MTFYKNSDILCVEFNSTEEKAMTNTRLLQGKMKSNSFTVESLAKEVGMSRTGLFNKIHNIREFTVTEMLSVSRKLMLTPDERDEIFFANL